MLSSFVCPKLRSASSGCSAWQPASEATSTIASTSSVGRTPVAALNRNASEYSRYGSTTHKQVYIYGGLDTGATEFNRNFGMAWGIGGWLLFPFLQKIGPYAGRPYAPDEAHTGWDDQLTYLFGLSDGSMIDGAQGGNATRHLNHACDPNVEAVEDCNAADDRVLVIHTTRDIRAGEELFLDYALDVGGDDPAAYPCECGAARCRGTLAATHRSQPFVEA